MSVRNYTYIRRTILTGFIPISIDSNPPIRPGYSLPSNIYNLSTKSCDENFTLISNGDYFWGCVSNTNYDTSNKKCKSDYPKLISSGSFNSIWGCCNDNQFLDGNGECQ